MNYFSGCHTLAELKQRRGLYAKALHPDRGGDPEQFREMNQQYERAQQLLGQRQNKQRNRPDPGVRSSEHQQRPVIVVQQVVQNGQSDVVRMLETILMKGAEMLLREGIAAITNNDTEK